MKQIKVVVIVAWIAAPCTLPVLLFKPLGTSSERTGRLRLLTVLTSSRYLPLRSVVKFIPNNPSITASQLFFTGISRSASAILADQHSKSMDNDKKMLENLHFTKQLGLESKTALVNGDTNKFGELLHEHWTHKKARSNGMSNQFVDEIYEAAIKNGAIGGKIVGAGGGGFLLFYASDKEKIRNEMKKYHLDEIRFQFDFEGTKVIVSQ